MSRRHNAPKSRPVAAIIIVATTVFLLLGSRCGVLGALVDGSVDRLLGAAGLGLLCVTAWSLAFILATPPGTFTRIIVALWRARPKHTPSVVVVQTRGDERTRGGDVDAGSSATVSAPAPRDRRELQAVKDALKGLGYEKYEYEPLVAQMDASLGFEKNVKSALKSLRVN